MHDMENPKSNIGGIYCFDRFGEALAYSVFCIRAEKWPHPDNTGKRDRAYDSMISAGWTPDELERLKSVALKHGTHGVEEIYA